MNVRCQLVARIGRGFTLPLGHPDAAAGDVRNSFPRRAASGQLPQKGIVHAKRSDLRPPTSPQRGADGYASTYRRTGRRPSMASDCRIRRQHARGRDDYVGLRLGGGPRRNVPMRSVLVVTGGIIGVVIRREVGARPSAPIAIGGIPGRLIDLAGQGHQRFPLPLFSEPCPWWIRVCH
jgi:hypothetical protein